MTTPTLLFRFLVALLLPASAAAGDVLMLKDGRFVEGVKIEKAEGGYKLLYKHGSVLVPEAMVKEALIEGQESYVPVNDEEKVKLEKGLRPFEGKWISKADRDAQIAKRQAEKRKKIDSAKAHREWRNRYITKGKSFLFEYTVDPEVFENLKDLMETYYTVFTKEWGIVRPPKLGPLKVCFYHNYESFLQVGGVPMGVLGYYVPDPAKLELNFFHDRLDPEFTIEVMFHETNHYLTHLIDLDFHYPHCINEAFAEYYGASKWDPAKKQMTVGHLLEGRLTEVKTDIQEDKWAKLDEYLTDKLGYDDYTWGWTFVHFMMQTPKYAPKFKKFYVGLARDKDVKRTSEGGRKTVAGDDILAAFKKYMGIQDIGALEKEWHAYVKQLEPKSSRGFEEAAKAAYGTGQRIRAKRFYKLAVEAGSTNPNVYNTYADLLSADGKQEEALAHYRKAIAIDPLNAAYYADLGRAMRMGGASEEKKKEGTRLVALAREIDPDNLGILIDETLLKDLAELENKD